MDAKHHGNNPDQGLGGLVCAALLGAVVLLITAAGLCHVSATCRLLI
ncbi:MAG TPA: hypothetical protein VKR38_16850 [Usitatibacter sp.]|nr:hypothetical protein [Usitatibacter sp.]